MTSLLHRAAYVQRQTGEYFSGKIGGPIVVARRAGHNFTLAQLLLWYFINDMIVVGSSYWNIGVAGSAGKKDMEKDTEGIETIRHFAKSLARVMKNGWRGSNRSDSELTDRHRWWNESIRVGLFDIARKLKAFVTSFRPSSQPGWAEQDPEQWWACLCTAMRSLLQKERIPPERIKALALDATSCTVVFLDRHMKPLRNALLWMDVRANREAELIAESGHSALKYNGYGNVSPEWMPCKALWIKRHEPHIYEKSKAICEYLDYMNYRLTGVYAAAQ
jgi:hypothetical protein